MMIAKTIRNSPVILLGLLIAGVAVAAGGDLGTTVKQETNWVAIAMFLSLIHI